VKDFSTYRERRERLLELVRERHGDEARGPILLFANFEESGGRFRQESSFYYLTGVREPGVALMIEPEGRTTLFMPNYGDVRAHWMPSVIECSEECAQELMVDEVCLLGEQCTGYQLHPFFVRDTYENLLERVADICDAGAPIFSLSPQTVGGYVTQRQLLARLTSFLPALGSALVDISPIVAQMRRQKDKQEVGIMYRAVEATMLAHQAAAQAIGNDMTECEVQAHLEFIMTGSCMHPAFASVVASGANSTVLHYDQNSGTMHDGNLVVVDVGAEFDHYCGDITRTYPVSGEFTDRQRELYEAVLETQEYIADLAKPGMWLSNKDEPSKSLHHLAKAFLAERGLDQHFIHGIGHYLGLDVHDVGSYQEPLQAGDVITIEPGVYIPEEGIGIRIEDDYWIVGDGSVCLSEQLPKSVEEIEQMAQAVLYAEDIEIGEDS